MISEKDIPRIDVKETLADVLGDPQCVQTILESLAQEQKGGPIEFPPEDMWDLMIYNAQRKTLFTFADPRENTPDRLMDFIKLPRPLQQKILYRCVFVFRKFFTFGSARLHFPIRFVQLSEVAQ